MNNNKYFSTVGGIKKFQETSGMIEDLSKMDIRQVIKLKYNAKKNLKAYMEVLSTREKRLLYTRYLRSTIALCSEIQDARRKEAIDYYYSLPKEERTPKNWNKYVAECSKGNSQRVKEVFEKKKREHDTNHLKQYQYKKYGTK